MSGKNVLLLSGMELPTIPSGAFSLLQRIALCGSTSCEWKDILPIVEYQYLWVLQRILLEEKTKLGGGGGGVKNGRRSMDEIVDGETLPIRLARVLRFLHDMEGPPFTLQRMCELILEFPPKQYATASKYFQAFSKLVCGISIPPNEFRDLADMMEVDSPEDILETAGFSLAMFSSSPMGGIMASVTNVPDFMMDTQEL